MSLRLPGSDLFDLNSGILKPELFERILYPSLTWSEICRDYEFYDGLGNGLFIVNIRPKRNGSHTPGGDRDRQKLKNMVFSGDVVMLNKGYSPAGLFYIDEAGELRCRNTGAFSLGGTDRIVRAYRRSVSREDYRHRDGKPRPTPDRYLRPGGWQEDNPLNSQFAGSWLAAAGMYHQQQEAFGEIARRAGPEAERGYRGVAGSTTAKVAMAAGSVMRGSRVKSVEKMAGIPAQTKPASVKKQRVFWKSEPVNFKGNKVYKRNDLFDPAAKDARGRTNLQRMGKGLAPLDKNGQPVNLHHMLQKQDGPIAELTQDFHKKNHKVIHINDNSIPSGINRAEFDKWRTDYWKTRKNDF